MVSIRGLVHIWLLAGAWAADAIAGGRQHPRMLHNEKRREDGQEQNAKSNHAKRQSQQHPHWFGNGRGGYPTGYYDYIVIGSGAGGGVVAPRLARYGFSVLLIEAGDDQGDQITVKVPALQAQSTGLISQRWVSLHTKKHPTDRTQSADHGPRIRTTM